MLSNPLTPPKTTRQAAAKALGGPQLQGCALLSGTAWAWQATLSRFSAEHSGLVLVID